MSGELDTGDSMALAVEGGPTGAERKRELERRRRETLYGRFRELERVVAETKQSLGAAAPSEPDPPLNTRRWDKEAVLVDALLHIRRQASRLHSLQEQHAVMVVEIEEAKREKDELRKDKVFLRNELETSREECAKLRGDNLNLWRACREAPTLNLSARPSPHDTPRGFQDIGTNAKTLVPLSPPATPEQIGPPQPENHPLELEHRREPQLQQQPQSQPQPHVPQSSPPTIPQQGSAAQQPMAVLTDAETGKELAMMSQQELAEVFGDSVNNMGPQGGTLLSDFLVSMRDGFGGDPGGGGPD